MTHELKSWNVPAPGKTELNGLPIYWRFSWTVEEDGIKALAEQLVSVHETTCFVWLAPAHWFSEPWNNADPADIYARWLKKQNRYAVKKCRKGAERTYAYLDKKQAFESLLGKQTYRLMRLKQEVAVCKSLVVGLKETATLIENGTEIIDVFNYGHNSETENWVFY